MSTTATIPTKYWHALDDGRVQCDVCPRACKLRDGQRGLCFVRGARGRRVVLTTYGRSSGFCVDPIEKKPLNHFLPGSSVLSFGTAGCNLACRFCQNWDISKSQGDRHARRRGVARGDRPRGPSARLPAASPSPTTTRSSSSSTRSTSPTPATTRGIAAVAVTAGYMCPEPRARVLRAHRRGQRRPQGLHRGLLPPRPAAASSPRCSTRSSTSRDETDVWLELTTLLIPGLNDSDAELDAHDPLGRRAPRPRRADALHRVPPRLQDARPAADAARRRSRGRAGSRWRTASATPTRATSTTATAAAPTATAAARG